MIDFRYDQLYDFSGIKYNGKHSYLDFGITLRPLSKFKEPQVKKITESVPFMDGEYIFTYFFGKPAYSQREFTLDFTIYGNDRKDLYRQKSSIVAWLYSGQGSELIFDDFPELICTGVYANVTGFEFVGNERAILTVDFLADPYLSNGKQNITLISSCPPYMGDTFGYIYVSSGEIKTATTDNAVKEIQFDNVSQGVYECKITDNSPSEFAVSLYLSTMNSGGMEAEDADGNITSIPIAAAADLTDGRIEVYHYREAEHSKAVKIRYKVTDITTVRTIKAMSFDDTATVLNAPVFNTPIKCIRDNTNIEFSINGGNNVTEAKLSQGGNIIFITGTRHAEIYLASRKEVL